MVGSIARPYIMANPEATGAIIVVSDVRMKLRTLQPEGSTSGAIDQYGLAFSVDPRDLFATLIARISRNSSNDSSSNITTTETTHRSCLVI